MLLGADAKTVKIEMGLEDEGDLLIGQKGTTTKTQLPGSTPKKWQNPRQMTTPKNILVSLGWEF